MLTTSERVVLGIFRQYMVATGEMLCFHGKWHDDHEAPLRQLTAKKLITKEQFRGGYSLTAAGFAAVRAPQRSEKPALSGDRRGSGRRSKVSSTVASSSSG